MAENDRQGGVPVKILIAEDDMASRKYLYKLLSAYGECDMTVDGLEALDAVLLAISEKEPYQLICLDIMMPKLDGIKALKAIREIEKQHGIKGDNRAKIIMTSALNDTEFVFQSFDTGCEAYASKPVDTNKLIEVLRKMDLIS
jgi:two-component system, chemotaxis family, chemotaxis protein CheY